MSGNTGAGLIWSIAGLLRGDYKQADYGKVLLPFTLLRRLDCVLTPRRRGVPLGLLTGTRRALLKPSRPRRAAGARA